MGLKYAKITDPYGAEFFDAEIHVEDYARVRASKRNADGSVEPEKRVEYRMTVKQLRHGAKPDANGDYPVNVGWMTFGSTFSFVFNPDEPAPLDAQIYADFQKRFGVGEQV